MHKGTIGVDSKSSPNSAEVERSSLQRHEVIFDLLHDPK